MVRAVALCLAVISSPARAADCTIIQDSANRLVTIPGKPQRFELLIQ